LTIRTGDTATTVGQLRPAGRISINGQMLDATSPSGFIDAGVDVVIVAGDPRRVVVRPQGDPALQQMKHGRPLRLQTEAEPAPFESPDAWVERCNAGICGLVAGVVLVPIVWLCGVPASVYAIFTPVAGAFAGWLFRRTVGIAASSAAPREDHRPAAIRNAAILVACTCVGAAIGLGAGSGYIGLSCGNAHGALAGSMAAAISVLLSFF